MVPEAACGIRSQRLAIGDSKWLTDIDDAGAAVGGLCGIVRAAAHSLAPEEGAALGGVRALAERGK